MNMDMGFFFLLVLTTIFVGCCTAFPWLYQYQSSNQNQNQNQNQLSWALMFGDSYLDRDGLDFWWD